MQTSNIFEALASPPSKGTPLLLSYRLTFLIENEDPNIENAGVYSTLSTPS